LLFGAGDVSGKTSFLVVGDQCSRRKFLKVRGLVQAAMTSACVAAV
jgi:hypothetical protein